MLRWIERIAVTAIAIGLVSTGATAAPCANPKALGVSRTIAVDPRAMPFVGKHDYGVTLPLAPNEVVLTFDDGPRPPYTNRVLKALSDECLRATFFVVGRQARAYPSMVTQLRAAGHTVGTHSQNHPLVRLPLPRAMQEIEAGVASVTAALGGNPAPFFRFPGLHRTREAERYLRGRGMMVWSVDVDSYDWKRIGAKQMLDSTMSLLSERRGGILLMHDVNPKTAHALPVLIARLKAKGFRIVHVVPRGPLPPSDQVASRAVKTKTAARKRPVSVADNAGLRSFDFALPLLRRAR